MTQTQLAKKRGARTLKRSKISGKVGRDWIKALLRREPRLALRMMGGEEPINE